MSEPLALLGDFFPGAPCRVPEGVGSPLARAVDQPFGDFLFAGKSHAWSDLPRHVQAAETRWVFYGKPVGSAAQASEHAVRVFQYGRETRGAAHREVLKHVQGINAANHGISGFMQTGRIREIIEQKYVLGQRVHGLLYVIDCAGAQVLDVDALGEWLGHREPNNGEGEILFSACLPPTRVLGAAIYQRDAATGQAGVLEVLVNPNYRERAAARS